MESKKVRIQRVAEHEEIIYAIVKIKGGSLPAIIQAIIGGM